MEQGESCKLLLITICSTIYCPRIMTTNFRLQSGALLPVLMLWPHFKQSHDPSSTWHILRLFCVIQLSWKVQSESAYIPVVLWWWIGSKDWLPCPVHFSDTVPVFTVVAVITLFPRGQRESAFLLRGGTRLSAGLHC